MQQARALARSQIAAHARRSLASCPLGHATTAAKPIDQCPGPHANGILAGLRDVLRTPEQRLKRANDIMTNDLDKFGPVYVAAKVAGKRSCIVSSPDYLKVFETGGDNYAGIFETIWPLQHYYRLNHPNEPLNPFLQRGQEWRKGRMSINPHLFNVSAAKSYLPQINIAAASAVAHVRDYEENVDQFVKYAVIDMFNATALGLNVQATAGDLKGRESTRFLAEAITELTDLLTTAPWSMNDRLKFGAWKRFEQAWARSLAEIEHLMDECVKDPSNHGFLPMFMRAEHNVTRFQALDMVAFLMFAATDTMVATLGNVLLHLGRNPAVQAQLRQTLRAELDGKDWGPDTRCAYLNWVLYENQRLSPTLTLSHIRHNLAQDVEIEGYRIPAGSSLVLSHHLVASKVDRPNEFWPDRWSDGEKAKRKGTPLEFLDHPIVREPFGFGPRKCVGSRIALLQLKSLLSRLVQDFEFHVDESTSAPVRGTAGSSNLPSPFPHIRFTAAAAR